MTDERTVDRLIAHLRGHVSELRRLEREGAAPHEVAEHKRLIRRVQDHLSYAVRDRLAGQRGSPVRPTRWRPSQTWPAGPPRRAAATNRR